jgi:thiol-disulfide isomerase/thioredoxin
MFEVKEISKIIGKALIRQGTIEEDDWVGVEQYLEWELASARDATGAAIRPTHQEALKRIVPDNKGEVQIYYFFSLSCTYCRKMASDIERLWQVTKGDSKIKFVALTVTPETKPLVASYRKYTGLTAPIFEGSKTAKSFNVAFIPAVVIVTPSNNVAYIKSGQQQFVELYETVRTAQGLPTTLTPEIERLIKAPIGEEEAKTFRARLATPKQDQESAVHTVSYRKSKIEIPSF